MQICEKLIINDNKQWLARLIAIQEVPGSIPGYTLEMFLEV